MMGDDLPDMEIMKMAGISACPKNSVPEVKEISASSFLNDSKVKDFGEQEKCVIFEMSKKGVFVFRKQY